MQQYSPSNSSSPEMKYESVYRSIPSAYASSDTLPSPPHRWGYSQHQQHQQNSYLPSTQAPLSPAPTMASDDMNSVWISPEADLAININSSSVESSPSLYYRNDLYTSPSYSSAPLSYKGSRTTSMAPSYRVQKNTRKPKKVVDPATKTVGRVTCDQCGKTFERPWNLQSHKKTHDAIQPRPFLCPGIKENGERCPNAFKRKTDCTRHYESVHQKLKPWACHMCKHTFSRKDTLTRHEKDGCNKRSHIPSKDGGARHFGKSFASGYYAPHQITSDAIEMHIAYQGQTDRMDYESSSSGSPPPPYVQSSAPTYPLRIAPTYAAQNYRVQTMSSGLPPLSDVVSVHRPVWQ